jgi:hypothetical protein
MSLTNKIVANIKKTHVSVNSFLNSDNVVCIDTSNNRIGINTKTPRYSIDIIGTDPTNLIYANKLVIGNNAIIKDISCQNNIDASSAIIKHISYTTISGSTVNSRQIKTISAEIFDLSISNLALINLRTRVIESSNIIIDTSGYLRNITINNLTIDGAFNIQNSVIPTYSSINVTGNTNINTMVSTNSYIRNIECSNISVDICANFYRNAFFNIVDISNIGTFKTLSGDLLKINTIRANDISCQTFISRDCSINGSIYVDNIRDLNGDTIFSNGALNLQGRATTVFNTLNISDRLTVNICDVSTINVKKELKFENNTSIILPSFSSSNTFSQRYKSIAIEEISSNMNVLKIYNSNNKWSNIYTINHYASVELDSDVFGNYITYDSNSSSYFINDYNNLIINLNDIKYKYVPIKFKIIDSKTAQSGFFNIQEISAGLPYGKLQIPDISGIYEINATISMKYVNKIPGDVEPNTYTFGLYNNNLNVIATRRAYVENINNILTFDNSFNCASSSLNYIGPLYSNSNGFVFCISSSKELEYLAIYQFNSTIKLLNY